MTTDQTDDPRTQLLDALDFSYCQGLGYGTPEELLAAYDASRTPPPADRACAGEEGFCVAHGFHRHALSQPPADRTVGEVDADTVANRAAQVITAMGADVRELKHSRDRYRAAWRNARRRAAVLSAEITRRAPLLGEYAAQIANLRTMYAASEARVSDLIDERDQLATDYAEERAERKVVQDKAARARAEVERLRADRAAVLREAADAVAAHPGPIPYRPQLDEDGGFWWDTRDRDAIVALLRRMADETQPEPATACAHCGGDHSWDDCKAYTALVAADETQPAQAPAAEPEETDEQRADREETERDHARGDHTYCGITCEIEMPTEHLRNFVIAKGYPGTKGALAELERRAHAEAAADLPARIDRMRPEFTEHASIAAIDAQLDRARRQERRWHLRVEWLIGLRQARTEQPAAGAQQGGVGISPPPA